jgi:NADH-quinone oxidoreductase subunit M
VVTTFQRDFKRLVAYSSVVHISPIPIILFFRNSVSTATLNIVLVFHGIASPLLFFFVGIVYLYSGSRNLVYVRRRLVVIPFIRALLTFVFLISVPTPPFPGFFSELLLLTNLVINFKIGAVFVFFVVVFSLVYNLM